MTSPFDFVNSINTTKEDIMVDDLDEKTYVAFMTNRQLSYFQDTVLLANEMNINHQIDNKLQYDFLRNTVRKRKRFSKWGKKETSDHAANIKDYYHVSEEKAYQMISLLSEDQLATIRLFIKVIYHDVLFGHVNRIHKIKW